MREQDLHRRFNDVTELLGETKFPGEPNRKPSRRKSQLDRIEALLKKILELLNIRQEATRLDSSVGPAVPLGDPDPEDVPVSSTAPSLPKGATAMAEITDKGQVGTKSRVRLFPLAADGTPRTIDLQDGTTTVESTDSLKGQGVRVAEDGLSYIYERLAVTDKNPDGSPIMFDLNAKTDADLDKGEQRLLVSTIHCEIVTGPVPEADDVNSVVGPAVPLSDPDPE
jgi:hypothetical protein